MDRPSQLAQLRRLWLHLNVGGRLTEDDERRWGFEMTKDNIAERIVALEEQEWKNVG